MSILRTALPDLINPNIPTVSASGIRATGQAFAQLGNTASQFTNHFIQEVNEQQTIRGQLEGQSNVIIGPDGKPSLVNNQLPKPGTTYANNFRQSSVKAYQAGVENYLSIRASEIAADHPFDNESFLKTYGSLAEGMVNSAPKDLQPIIANNAAIMGSRQASSILLQTKQRSNQRAAGNLITGIDRVENQIINVLENQRGQSTKETNDALEALEQERAELAGGYLSNPNGNVGTWATHNASFEKRKETSRQIGMGMKNRDEGGISAVYKQGDALRNNTHDLLTFEERNALANTVENLANVEIAKATSLWNNQETQRQRGQLTKWRELQSQNLTTEQMADTIASAPPGTYSDERTSQFNGFMIQSHLNNADGLLNDGDVAGAAIEMSKAMGMSLRATPGNNMIFQNQREAMFAKMMQVERPEARARAKAMAAAGAYTGGIQKLRDLGFSPGEVESILQTHTSAARTRAKDRLLPDQIMHDIRNGRTLSQAQAAEWDKNSYDLGTTDGLNAAVASTREMRTLPADVSRQLISTLENGDSAAAGQALAFYNSILSSTDREGARVGKQALANSLTESQYNKLQNFSRNANDADPNKGGEDLGKILHSSSLKGTGSVDRRSAQAGMPVDRVRRNRRKKLNTMFTDPAKHYASTFGMDFSWVPFIGRDLQFTAFGIGSEEAKEADRMRELRRDAAGVKSLENISVPDAILDSIIDKAEAAVLDESIPDIDDAMEFYFLQAQDRIGVDRQVDGSYEFVEWPISIWGNRSNGVIVTNPKTGEPEIAPVEISKRPPKPVGMEGFANDALEKHFHNDDKTKWLDGNGEGINVDTVRLKANETAVNDPRGPSYEVTYLDSDGVRQELHSQYRYNYDKSRQKRNFDKSIDRMENIEIDKKNIPVQGEYVVNRAMMRAIQNNNFKWLENVEENKNMIRGIINDYNHISDVAPFAPKIDISDDSLEHLARLNPFIGLHFAGSTIWHLPGAIGELLP